MHQIPWEIHAKLRTIHILFNHSLAAGRSLFPQLHLQTRFWKIPGSAAEIRFVAGWVNVSFANLSVVLTEGVKTTRSNRLKFRLICWKTCWFLYIGGKPCSIAFFELLNSFCSNDANLQVTRFCCSFYRSSLNWSLSVVLYMSIQILLATSWELRPRLLHKHHAFL